MRGMLWQTATPILARAWRGSRKAKIGLRPRNPTRAWRVPSCRSPGGAGTVSRVEGRPFVSGTPRGCGGNGLSAPCREENIPYIEL